MFHPKHVLFSLKNVKKIMNFKSIMWFIKAISYFMLLQSLNNNNSISDNLLRKLKNLTVPLSSMLQ